MQLLQIPCDTMHGISLFKNPFENIVFHVIRVIRIKINLRILDRENFPAVFAFPEYFFVTLDSLDRGRSEVLPIDDFMRINDEIIVAASAT
jgi:hypothetical protein